MSPEAGEPDHEGRDAEARGEGGPAPHQGASPEDEGGEAAEEQADVRERVHGGPASLEA